MFWKARDQISYDQPIVQIAKRLDPSPESPFQHQKEHSGEDLVCCGKAET